MSVPSEELMAFVGVVALVVISVLDGDIEGNDASACLPEVSLDESPEGDVGAPGLAGVSRLCSSEGHGVVTGNSDEVVGCASDGTDGAPGIMAGLRSCDKSK